MSLCLARLSPALALKLRSISSACVRRLPCPMCARYLARSSGVSDSRSIFWFSFRFSKLAFKMPSSLVLNTTSHGKDTYVCRPEIVASDQPCRCVPVPCGGRGYTWSHGEYLPHPRPHRGGRCRHCGLLAGEQGWGRRGRNL